jgi:DNA-binding beta-propeller fold protein YncE
MTKYFLLVITLTCSFFGLCCKDQVTNDTNTTENKMYVYSNYGNTFYLIDYKTFEVVREIQLTVPDSVDCNGMAISTNRDYLFLKAEGPYPSPPFGFAIYDINKEKLQNVFFTEFKGAGPAYFISAQNNSAPGVIYVHFRDYGTYSIDLFEQKVKELINNEHDFTLDKRIFHSPDGEWTVVHNNWSINLGSYSELEFYTSSSGLHDLQFVLNESNKDSISVYDFEFSKDNKLYISYQLSGGRSRGIESYFGSYDLKTKQLYRSSLKFPWSLNPYYTAYSPNRNEVFLIGGYDKFYIISGETYTIKNTITLSGKINGSSQILISPEENIAFISCPNSNSIFVIDLNSRQVIKTIAVTKPYNMIIP